MVERFRNAHAQLVKILERLTPELAEEKREHLVEVSRHYVEHLPALRAAIETNEPA
ncbi:MAG TPA: hypothetical protein PKD27_13510 [Tepidiformaceae bacterium]|nr:hypothetical protein [Tepidiformaceae bacterium]